MIHKRALAAVESRINLTNSRMIPATANVGLLCLKHLQKILAVGGGCERELIGIRIRSIGIDRLGETSGQPSLDQNAR
jgi:hypothetical protein